MKKYVKNLYKNMCVKYNLNKSETRELFKYIYNIMFHKEFLKRTSNNFLHHGNTTLGEHILEDTIIAYKLSKNSKNKVNKELTVKISMMHDLYCEPWQNNKTSTKFKHAHGFRHPVEAAINSMVWFKEEFDNPVKAEILLEGIVHHMYPLPVMSFRNTKDNIFELRNFDLLKEIPIRNIKLLEKVCDNHFFNNFSFRRSKYIEGRVMSKADKKASLNQFNNMSSVLALVTGKNKTIEE